MENKELQTSLVKSGIVSGLFVFFIYAFAVSVSGGVICTLSSLFTGAVFLFGLAVALAVSIAVMFGIYFGILYIYDKDTCKSTYAEFKIQLHESTKDLCCCPAIAKCLSRHTSCAVVSEDGLRPLHSNQEALKSQLDNLQTSIAAFEKTLSSVTSSIVVATEEIAKLDEKVDGMAGELEKKSSAESLEETTKKLSADIAAIQGTVKPLNNKISAIETALSSFEREEKDAAGAQDEVTSVINGIQEELAQMKGSMESLRSSSLTVAESSEEEDNHRILSRFTSKNDEKNFTKYVTEAVSQKMTYAQIDDFLKKSLSAEASAVIAEHPSLTKDYIRMVRQKA